MGVRSIQLRRRGRCHSCRTELWAGDPAYYDDVARHVTCRSCALGDRPPLPLEGLTAPAADPAPASPPAPRRPSSAERARVKALIADARAALAASKHAS